ncbi:hypothetical protein ACLQ9N_05110 [Gallibacterium anatis]|uniref:hypothetical protein n=1 Tax=Gallibacterium anatis TaxID=750 RepID=UPI003004BBF0
MPTNLNEWLSVIGSIFAIFAGLTPMIDWLRKGYKAFQNWRLHRLQKKYNIREINLKELPTSLPLKNQWVDAWKGKVAEPRKEWLDAGLFEMRENGSYYPTKKGKNLNTYLEKSEKIRHSLK